MEDYKLIEANNKLINEFLGREPKISYVVGTKDAICYDASTFTDYAPSQKEYCERFLKEQHDRYPDGWVTKGGYDVMKLESFPNYQSDWNELMTAGKKAYDVCQTQDRPNVNACNNLDWLETTISCHIREYEREKAYTAIIEFIVAYNQNKSQELAKGIAAQ